jgi:tetratricopeptide (TPR) repeat protein
MKSNPQSEKIIWFEKFFPELLKKPFKEGIAEAKRMQKEAKLKGNPEDTGIAIFAEGLLNRFSHKHSKCLTLYNKAMKLFRETDSKEWIAALEHGIGHCYDVLGNPREAERYYLTSYKFYHENKILKREAMLCVNLGQSYIDTGESKKALHFLNSAYRIFSKLKDVHAQAVTLNNIATNYRAVGDNLKALKFYNAGLKVFLKLKDYDKVVGNYTNLGSVNIFLGNYKSAEQNLLKAKSYITDSTEKYIAINVYINLGIVYLKTRKYEKAELNLLTAIDEARTISDNNLLTKALIFTADLKSLTGKIEVAKKYYSEALKLITRYNYGKEAIEVNEKLSSVYEKEKNYAESLKYHKELLKAYSSIYNEDSFKEISVLKAEIEKQNAENKAEILHLKNLKLKREIEIKTGELNQAANYIMQKNDFLNSVMNDVRSYINSLDTENLNKEKFFSQLGLIERKKRLNEEVVHFEENLNNMNVAFLNKLSRKFPALTRIELKICSLMKINLGTKDIAKLLSISHRTIETHRHHIIQKLKLPKGKSLSSFINTL